MRPTRFSLVAVGLVVFCPSYLFAKSTDLSIHPGLTVNFSVYNGFDSSGNALGDYTCIIRVTNISGNGYRYEYRFTSPHPYSGSQTISSYDRSAATKVHEFLGDGDQSAPGYFSYLAISNATFADLKAGKETPLIVDGPENPQSIKPIGAEDFSILLDERQTTVHTIKAQGAAGGTFWIIDSPNLPMVVKGEYPRNQNGQVAKWIVTGVNDEQSEGSHVVSDLSHSGEAVTHSILFAFNSAELDEEAKPVLSSVAQYLIANPRISVEIQGHTDNFGGPSFNLTLSQERADSVKSYLTHFGVNPGRLTAKGYGLTKPVADNDTPEGRANNRRVVFLKQ